MDNEKQVLDSLKNFQVKDWIRWLKNNLENLICEPAISLGDVSTDVKLTWIKNRFEANGFSTRSLGKAVVALINEYSATTAYAEDLYYLINFAGLLKPEEHADELSIIFSSNLLIEKVFHGKNLHMVLLNALINFVNIPDFTYYFDSKINNPDSIYWQLGLKYYYRKRATAEYFSFVFKIIKSLEGQNKEKHAEGIVHSFNEMTFYKKNYNELYNWWVETSSVIRSRYPSLFEELSKSLLMWLNEGNNLVKKNDKLFKLKHYTQGVFEPDVKSLDNFLSHLDYDDLVTSDSYGDNITVIGPYILATGFNQWNVLKLGKAKMTQNKYSQEVRYDGQTADIFRTAAQISYINKKPSADDRKAFKKELSTKSLVN